MVTNFNQKDLVSFARFADERSAKGMLFKDENGRNIITEATVEDWLLTLRKDRNFICPKVQSVTQELMTIGKGIYIDHINEEISGITNTHFEAFNNGVLIAGPMIEHGDKKKIVFAGCVFKRKQLLELVSIKENGNGIHFIDAKIPHMQFPIYENGDVVGIGIVVHKSDL